MKLSFDQQREKTDDIWGGDWKSRIMSLLRQQNADSMQQLANRFPAEPYEQLAKRLGDNVAPLQLIWLQFAEAVSAGGLRAAAADSLAREISGKVKRGWERGKHAKFNKANAFASWATHLEKVDPKTPAFSHAVWEALVASSPPIDWLPSGPDDPLIRAAFDKGWPASERSTLMRQPYGMLCPKCTAVLTTPSDNVDNIRCPHCGDEIELH